MLRTAIVLASLWHAAAPTAAAQNIVVAIDVREETNGLIESAIHRSLSRRSDIDVVMTREASHRWEICAISVCVPNPEACDSASHYSISILLLSAIDTDALAGSIRSISRRAPGVRADSAPDFIEGLVRNLTAGSVRVMRYTTIVAERDEYEQAIGDAIAGIDRDCFEADRLRQMYDAAIARGDPTLARALLASLMALPCGK